MRKPSFYTALIVMVCTLATVLAAFTYSQKQTMVNLSALEDKCPEKIESVATGLLWESLSSQFVSSIHN